jgi:DNA-binding transcriptional regulator YiaG
MSKKRVQFNVRVREDVAKDLREEAALRAIGMGELVELLNENYRAGTRSGHWLELDPPLEAALTALAAVRGEDPERVLQALVAGVVRQQLQSILDHLPSRESILSGAALAAISNQTSADLRAPSQTAGSEAQESGPLQETDSLDELEIDSSGWIEPDEVELTLESIELEAVSDADIAIEAMEWDEESSPDTPSTEQQPAPQSESAWDGDGERRRRSREITLSEADQRRFDALPASLPRTGDELRQFRQQRGLSPSALGSLCGVTQVAVGLWERKGALPAPILLKLGDGLKRYLS